MTTSSQRILAIFVQMFMRDLANHKIMDLEIPKTTNVDVLENAADEILQDNDTDVLLDYSYDANGEERTSVKHAITVSTRNRLMKTRNLFNAETARGYSQLFGIAAFVMGLLVHNQSVSLRDVYYALPHLFKTQAECNGCILEFGRMMEMKRHEMHIVPAVRGFMSGPIRFRFQTFAEHQLATSLTKSPVEFIQAATMAAQQEERATWIDCECADMGNKVSITSKWTSASIVHVEIHPRAAQSLRYILVVEKEGVFHRLLEDCITERLGCILVTGCGYPDIATRSAVCRISAALPHLTVVGLSDYNPHGLALLLTYRFPSNASMYEGHEYRADLKWCGMRSTSLQWLRLQSCDGETNDGRLDAYTVGVKELSQHDISKIRSMLNTQIIKNLPEHARELEVMLLGNIKFDIEAMYVRGIDFLAGFLQNVFDAEDFI